MDKNCLEFDDFDLLVTSQLRLEPAVAFPTEESDVTDSLPSPISYIYGN